MNTIARRLLTRTHDPDRSSPSRRFFRRCTRPRLVFPTDEHPYGSQEIVPQKPDRIPVGIRYPAETE